jgi:predicted phage replisome organizer
MRERKYVKFRVDMYDDTKFKIIDMKPERDLIHYVWTRIVTLAGKVNLEGDLYLSKNIPYTIETLAIEFNRDVDQIKLALDVLIDLEMIEFSEDKIYRVKNFVKHQNIKVKEKNEHKDNKADVKDKETKAKDDMHNKDKEYENKTSQNQTEKVRNDDSPVLLEVKRNKKPYKRKKKGKKLDITDEESEDSEIVCFRDVDEKRPLDKGECMMGQWSF